MFPLRWNFPFRKKDGSLSTIQDEIDNAGGGGGGSEVEITPILTEGTKIATFEIDGEEGDLYAPESSSGGGVDFVDLHPKQSIGSGARIDSVLLSDIISESDYNEYLVNKTIYAINVLDNTAVRLFGISGNTYSTTIFTWFGTGTSPTLGTGHTLRIFYVDNPTQVQ